jgi:quercetin dioxygenase-like cupin family protein
MKLFRCSQSPFRPADTSSFAGHAQTRLAASDAEQVPVNVYHVKFERRARTNWHSHSGAQFLIVTEGRVRVQRSRPEMPSLSLQARSTGTVPRPAAREPTSRSTST